MTATDAAASDAAYAGLLGALFERRTEGVRFGLDRVRAALAAAGHPERAFRVVHVAGTNGKGSTAAMCEAILRAAGVRTGLYTSPHLCRLTERVRVAGAEVSRAALVPHLEAALAAAGPLTFFEAVTVAAFGLLAEARVEIAVVEVGLGGRLDATNVVDAPLASVVTSIGLDHQAMLGDSLEAIAREKVAICKPGAPAILAAAEPAILSLLAEEARARGAGPVLRLGHELAPLPGPLSLAGEHQRRNAALAVAAASAALPGLAEAAIGSGLSAVRWPGRLEQLARGGQAYVLDLAHIAEGARALAVALGGLPRPRVLVFGVAADKDADAMLALLRPAVDTVIFTRGRSDRLVDPARLAKDSPSRMCSSVREALSAASAPGGTVVVAGSCYLVGEVRAELLGEPEDPVAVGDPAAR